MNYSVVLSVYRRWQRHLSGGTVLGEDRNAVVDGPQTLGLDLGPYLKDMIT